METETAFLSRLAGQFGSLPQTIAVALAGSRAAGAGDPRSDADLYVYSLTGIPVAFRRRLAGPEGEVDNRFWESGDEWSDPATGTRVDVMYRSPAWIEDQLDRVLVRHEASVGYSTCFWHNLVHSQALFDPRGWYADLQRRAGVPYPEALRRAIVAKNHPILRANRSSYLWQIELALGRDDAVSVQHRVTALLASVFDIWFALERRPHPGEKRLLGFLPESWAELVRSVLRASGAELPARAAALLDRLDARIEEEGLAGPAGSIDHVGVWVADLDRAAAFYTRWFQASAGPKYVSSRRPFESRFVTLASGARLELMAAPGEPARLAHAAVSVGSREAVERLVARMQAEGVAVLSAPRLTGDGFYEAVVADPEGNSVEITV